MAEAEYRPEGEQDHISKLAFTAVAAPDPVSPTKDLQYIPQGPPATTKEVWSYYSYVRACSNDISRELGAHTINSMQATMA